MPNAHLIAALLAAVTFVPFATAQVEPEQSSRHTVYVDSGLVQNVNPSPAARGIPEVVWSTVVTVPNASWLRLEYSGVLLAGSRDPGGDGSFLRLTSLRDGGQQRQHLRHVAEWLDTSAYFNGDAVLVELLAQPGTGDNRLVIDVVTAGPPQPAFPDDICGNADNRILSTDNRCARNQPGTCTSWMIDDCSHCFLTAGHCASTLAVLEFNVPLSTSSGSLQHPPPQDQYAVDNASRQTNNGGTGIGDDWTYFGVFANSNSGLTPFQAYGGQTFHLLPVPPAATGQTLRVTGYGSTSSPVSPTWHLVQKTHAAPFSSFSSSTIQYVVDTTGGNSGSPVFLDGTDQAIGIHTHGGCLPTGGVNSGTASNHAGLQAALAAPSGVCACPTLDFTFPTGLPNAVAPNGSGRLRVQITGPAGLVASSVRFYVDQGGGFQTSVPVALGNDVFECSFPPATCLTPIRFYVAAQDVTTKLWTSPPHAPLAAHAALTGDVATVVRSYDFNTAPPGWTVTSTAITAGSWARVVPTDPGGPSFDGDGSGRCWVTGNSTNENVDGGPTVLTSETFNLAATTDPHVSYSLWFTNSTNDDTLVVEASDNGMNWVTIETLSPFVGWTRHGFRVRDHFQTLGSLVVRFGTSDNPNNSITEAGVDAFRLVDAPCTPANWTAYGTGCPGSNGVPALQGVLPPSLGGIFALMVQNLGNGLPVLLMGLTPQNVPLQPYGLPAGCVLLASPDATAILIASGGVAGFNMMIPNSPALAGVHLFHQVLEVGTPFAVSDGGDAEIR